MVAAHVSVIGGKNHDGVVRLAALVERVEHAADLMVQLLDGRVVASPALAVSVLRHVSPNRRFAPVQARLAGERVVKALGHGNGPHIVSVEVFLQRKVRIVRLHKVRF